MSKSIVDIPPGKGLRLGLRLPIWLYRLNLGCLLGKRFLLLMHTGRSSELARQAVIEIIRHTQDTDAYFVVSGWGKKSDWYQNIRKTTSVTVPVAGWKFWADAECIPVEEAMPILESHGRKHAIAFRELTGLFLGDPLQAGSGPAQARRENAHGSVSPKTIRMIESSAKFVEKSNGATLRMGFSCRIGIMCTGSAGQ